MPHRKNRNHKSILNSGNLHCSCSQTIGYRMEREEKLKLRLHLKNCPNPPEGVVYYKMPANRNHMTYEEFQRLDNERYRNFYC